MNRFSGILDMFFYTTDTIDGEKTSLAFFFSSQNANFTRLYLVRASLARRFMEAGYTKWYGGIKLWEQEILLLEN